MKKKKAILFLLLPEAGNNKKYQVPLSTAPDTFSYVVKQDSQFFLGTSFIRNIMTEHVVTDKPKPDINETTFFTLCMHCSWYTLCKANQQCQIWTLQIKITGNSNHKLLTAEYVIATFKKYYGHKNWGRLAEYAGTKMHGNSAVG